MIMASNHEQIPVVKQELKPLCDSLNCVEGSPLQRINIDSSLPAGNGNEREKLQGGTVPFEEEGRDHTYTYARNEAEIDNRAGEVRRTFNETGNESFKLSTTMTTVDCYYERTDHQLQCNTTSAQDELAKTEGNTAVCQLSDSNSYKEDNDTKGVLPSVVYISNIWSTSKLKEKFQRDPRVVHIDRNSLHERQLHIKEGNMLVGFTSSILENVFMVAPVIDVDLSDLRRRTIDKERKRVQFFEMAPTGTTWRNGFLSICTLYKNVQTGDTIYVVHKNIFNYREVLAGLDVPKISPAIFCVIEADDKKIQMFMELIDPYVNLRGMIRLGKMFGKSGLYYVINEVSQAVNYIHRNGWLHGDLHEENILFQIMVKKIILRIIDYGNAQKIDGNENDEMNIGDDLSMTSEAISNICTSRNEIGDQLLNRFRGDNPEVLRNTEDLECLVDETALEAAKFATQYANKDHELMIDMFKSVLELTDSVQQMDISTNRKIW